MKAIRPWLPPVLALLWLGALEMACERSQAATPWLVVVLLSVALGIETWMLWVRGGSRAQKIAIGVVGGVAVIVAALDVIAHNVGSSQRMLLTYDEAAAKLPAGGSADAVCAGCKTLWHDDRLWVLGQPREEWFTCLYGIPGFESSSDSELVPADFAAYARLVDPERSRDLPLQGVFLSWQYPRQRFVLVRFNSDATSDATRVEVTTALENSHMLERGIYTVEPFFKSPGYEWTNRLTSYGNLLRFAFGSSPHCRTDLVDDPYFLIGKGERKLAQERLASLPPDRRAFVERKLAAPPPPPPPKPDDGTAGEP